jgi:DNA-directed RNA polymerase specialized sigma24 family protein
MLFDRQAVLIYGERNQFGTHSSECSPRTWMARIFHDRTIARIEQNTRSQVESLLRSGDDNHLPPIASNTPSGT